MKLTSKLLVFLVLLSFGCETASESSVDSKSADEEPASHPAKEEPSGAAGKAFIDAGKGASGSFGGSRSSDPGSEPSEPAGGTGSVDTGGAGSGSVGGSASVDAGNEPTSGGAETGGVSTTGVPWPPAAATTEEDVVEAEDAFGRFAACADLSTCPDVFGVQTDSGEAEFDSDGLRCLFEALARSEPGYYRHIETFPEGILETVLLAHPVGLSELITRTLRPDEADEFSTHELCVLQAPAYFQDCLDEIPEAPTRISGLDCASPGKWFVACGAADLPVTPCDTP